MGRLFCLLDVGWVGYQNAKISIDNSVCSIHGVPVIARVREVRFLSSSEVVRELTDPHFLMSHGHRVWNRATWTARSSLKIDNLCAIIWLHTLHGLQVRSRRLFLQVHVGGDVVRLTPKETLFIILGVDDWCVKP